MTERTLPGFLLTRHWRDTAAGMELEYWFATPEGPLCARVQGERPLFFLPAADEAAARSALAAESGWSLQPLALRDFTLQPVLGVYHSSRRGLRRLADRLREAGLEPLEGDVNPADRYLMERFIRGAALLRGPLSRRGGTLYLDNPQLRPEPAYRPNLRWVSLDIETAMQGLQLYSIGVHGVGPEGEQRRVFMVGGGATLDCVASFDDQSLALAAFLDWLDDFDPDVLIGWSVVNFDIWYLQRLADHLGMSLALGRDRRAAHWVGTREEGERPTVQLAGRVVLDGIEWLRAAFYRFESFSLENVSRQLLGEGKLLQGSDRGHEIGELYRRDKNRLAEYNLRDCELVSAVFRETALLDFALARSAMTGLAPDRLGGSVASFDNLYLPRLHRRGFVAPNASRDRTASPGGFVLDSAPGLYDHVLVLDFKSLYPSIIRTFHIDPLGLALGTAGKPAPADAVPGFLDARFARDAPILPDLISVLWRERDAARRAGDQPLSQAIKIIMNSFYGVLGSAGCRFFDARLASSITRRGHEILQRTRDVIEAAGHRVIYGDTDSVFVWIRDARDCAEAVATGEALERELNTWWRRTLREEFDLDSALELVFETHYRRFFMPTVRGSEKGSKKRYAGLVATPEGEQLVFKGLENVRTDWTRLARDFQRELYRRIFAGEPYADYVRGLAASLLAGERDGELVYRKRLRRRLADYQSTVPPHVQAARLGVQRGLPAPSRGSWIEYVITTAGPEPAASPLAPLDYQHYADRQLQPVADGILGCVGSSFAALVDRQYDLF